MVVNSISLNTSKAKVISLALFILLFKSLHSQNYQENIFDKNHWGIQILNSISPPFKIEPLKINYIKVQLLSNYQFGLGLKYIFNINAKYSIETGLYTDYKTISTKYKFNLDKINKELNFVLTTNSLSDFKNLEGSELTFGSFYQSYSIPIFFKFNFLKRTNFFLSAKTGVNVRYYFTSRYRGGASFTVFSPNRIDLRIFKYDIIINEKSSIEFDNQTVISISFILKNKKIITLSAISNIALNSVNKGFIEYLPNTVLYEKVNIITNDNYFGVNISYLFTGVNNYNKKLLKNRKIERFPKNDADY